ncbi:MAG: hypothetical protein JJW01_03590 [Alphaproteobacteria bacterium]|nr:hypothetical protein [Rickettsiales bacterium]
MSDDKSVKSIFNFLYKYTKNSKQEKKSIGLVAVQKEIENELLSNDVHRIVVNKIMIALKNYLINSAVIQNESSEEVAIRSFRSLLINSMKGSSREITIKNDKLCVITVYGFPGVGKTTFCGKLGQYLMKERDGVKIAIVSLDYKRKAGHEQLEAISKSIGARFIHNSNVSPNNTVSALECAIKKAEHDGNNVLIIDTPALDFNSAEEVTNLQLIHGVISNKLGPQHNFNLFVVDGMMGKTCYEVTSRVRQILPINSIAMSKGVSNFGIGSVINARFGLRKPILYVSFSERLSDLQKFNFLDFATDLINNVTRINKIGQSKEDRSFSNFYELKKHLVESKSLESISLLTSSIKDKKESKLKAMALNFFLEAQIAIIDSMTIQERLSPSIINDSRAKRIANGSGATVSQVTILCCQVNKKKYKNC